MQQAGYTHQDEAVTLFDLPSNCLHHIVSFMDKETKLQFFRASKGSCAGLGQGQEQPGCALLLLKTCRQCRFTASFDQQPAAGFSMLHWAARISKGIHMFVKCNDHDLHSILGSLLSTIQGRPDTYPGITSLALLYCKSSSLIPELLTAALPNLKRLSICGWRPDSTQPLAPVQLHGLTTLQHFATPYMLELRLDMMQHMGTQLSHMPSLTSLHLLDTIFESVPAPVLTRLKRLHLITTRPTTTVKLKDALRACSHLTRVTLTTRLVTPDVSANPLLHVLTQCVPHIQSLAMPDEDLGPQVLEQLLQLPQLTTLTVRSLSQLPHDVSTSHCAWKSLSFTKGCDSYVTQLGLATLTSPVRCSHFTVHLTEDHAADLAAIRAARLHLLTPQGIHMTNAELKLCVSSPIITKEQAAQLLEAWAPCFTCPPRRVCCSRFDMPLIADVVAQLWPRALIKESC